MTDTKELRERLLARIGSAFDGEATFSAEEAAEAASAIERLEAEVARLERNRDMWKGQCERQAVELTRCHEVIRQSDLAAPDRTALASLEGKPNV